MKLLKMSNKKRWNWILIELIFVLNVCYVNSNYPDETGGYSIVVAFEETIPEPVPVDASLLIGNIRTSLNTFSDKLWEVSKHKFYLKSVDILIPSSWNGVNATNSIGHKYDAATIRISLSDHVYAQNPFACGMPGSYIGLPLSFFNNSESGSFGPHWKVLLNVWASYRWGVHEEHGYVGIQSKYPYSHKNVITDEWEVTGCSDKPIYGQYMNNESLPCSASDTQNESSTCRFIPDLSNNATTSLMHFHWMDSIADFCDESNHNILSPNRQNSLCNYKSVWEVIRGTRDFQIVKNPIDSTLPPVEYNVVQHSKKPSFYILLDRGKIQGSLGLAFEIPRALASFMNTLRVDTIAAVGTFPGSEEDGKHINDAINWSTVGDRLDDFVDVIGTVPLNGSLQRNFAESILAASQKIKTEAHLNGVVMLVVKYGSDLSSFANYPPESEVVNALSEQGIILNSIELRMANHSGHAHLSELARQTGGVYTVVSSYGEVQTSLANVFWFLNNRLNEDHEESNKRFRTLTKLSTAPGSTTRVKVPRVSKTKQNLGKVEFYMSSKDGSLVSENFVLAGIDTNGSSTVLNDVTFRKRQDWFESGSKWTYYLGLAHDTIVPYLEVTIRLDCLACYGTIVVRTNIMDDASENITLSVFTNSENSAIDLSENGPIILYVKVFKSASPVVGAQIFVFITETTEQRTTSFSLADNGEGNPDMEVFDGIYSGYFTPNRDGNYKISVLAQGDDNARTLLESNLSTLDRQNTYGYGKLLPIDQDMRCNGATCDKATLTGDFMQSIELFTSLRVSNTSNYIPEPTKISELIITLDGNPEIFTLIWIAPTVPGTLFSVSSYDIRQASSKGNLITDFDNQEKVTGLTAITPGAPGSVERLQIAKPLATSFYAIRSEYRGRKSKISYIKEIEIRNEDTSTTPSSTTTTTTISTTSTSPSTSSSPGSTSAQPGTSSSTTVSTSTTDDTHTSFPTTTTTISTTSPAPSNDKKPWAKTGGGIAIITIVVIIVVSAIAFIIYYIFKMRGSSTGKINPPPLQPRSSIPL